MRHYELIFSGSGGQGLMFIGKMLAHLAIEEYPHVTFLPTYGAEVRSGTSYCNVKLSDEPIASPVIEWPDLMVLMNQPSVDRFLPRLRVGSIAFMNSSMATAECAGVIPVPANQIALEIGDVQAANVVMFAALLGHEALLDRTKALDAVVAASARKGERAVSINRQAFEAGWDLGQKTRRPAAVR